jgi:hypothetical protein
MRPYRQAARSGRFAGYQGPSTRKAAEVVTKYMIVDMYAKPYKACPPRKPQVDARNCSRSTALAEVVLPQRKL